MQRLRHSSTCAGLSHGIRHVNFIILSMLIVLVVGVLIPRNTQKVYACSFVPYGSLVEELAKYEVVFAGRVVEVHNVSGGVVYEFTVDTVWKGPLFETVYIERIENEFEVICGTLYWRFIQGEDYIVYGDGHLNSRTGFVESKNEDLIALGSGQAPVLGTSEPRPMKLDEINVPLWLIIVLATAGLGLPIGLVLRVRTQRRRSRQQAIAEIQRRVRGHTQGPSSEDT